MNDKALVSIIVPCYNQAQYLNEALLSILDQTYANWECILVNDGSIDNTEEVALSWCEKDNRFKYFFQKNKGLSSARNLGLANANGEFIQFLDSDDIIEHEKIKAQVNALVSDIEIDISVSGYRYFENSICELKSMGKNNFFPEVVLHKNDSDVIEVLNVKNPMVISAPVYRKLVFDKVGVFDEELVSLEDWEFHMRCALHGMKFQHLGIIMNTMTLVRLHDKSMMRNDEIMNTGNQMFLKKRNQNQLYIQYFKVNKLVNPANEVEKSKSRFNYFKKSLKLFIPPIFLIIKRKLF